MMPSAAGTTMATARFACLLEECCHLAKKSLQKLSDLSTSQREEGAASDSVTPLPRELETQEEGLTAGAPRQKETAAARGAGAPPPILYVQEIGRASCTYKI